MMKVTCGRRKRMKGGFYALVGKGTCFVRLFSVTSAGL